MTGPKFSRGQNEIKIYFRVGWASLATPHLRNRGIRNLNLQKCFVLHSPSIGHTAQAQPLRHMVVTIELDLNRGVSPFGPIRRQDTKIGGCHLAFFPITFVQGRGLNSESSWKCDQIWMQPSPETASHNLGRSTHWYSSIQSSSMLELIGKWKISFFLAIMKQ